MPLSLFAPLDHLLAPVPAQKKVGWLAGITYAHRGLHGPGAPENSPEAFRLAIAGGLGIECDIQRSGDGQAMVFHDWELDRLTGESGPVGKRSAAEIGAIRLSGGEEPIPTLRQVLGLIDGRVPILIEIKSRRGYHVAASCLAVRRTLEGYRGSHAVMSFDPRVSRWFASHSPHTVRGLVITEGGDGPGIGALFGRIRRRLSLWQAKPDFLAYDIRDLPSRFAAAQRGRGLPVTTWTVRSAEHRERAAQYADAPIAEGAGVRSAVGVHHG